MHMPAEHVGVSQPVCCHWWQNLCCGHKAATEPGGLPGIDRCHSRECGNQNMWNRVRTSLTFDPISISERVECVLAGRAIRGDVRYHDSPCLIANE